MSRVGAGLLDFLSKSIDLLKASGWQTAMIAVGCGLLLYLSRVGIIPAMDPWMVILAWAAMLIAAGLAVASLLSALQGVAESGWAGWRRRRARQSQIDAFRKHLPFLGDKERQILGYLRHNKQKTFIADHDGGYASTLLAQRFVYYIGVPGQTFDLDKTPMAVAEHVWTVMQEQPEAFPYKPEYNDRDDVETYPWRIPWQLR